MQALAERISKNVGNPQKIDNLLHFLSDTVTAAGSFAMRNVTSATECDLEAAVCTTLAANLLPLLMAQLSVEAPDREEGQIECLQFLTASLAFHRVRF